MLKHGNIIIGGLPRQQRGVVLFIALIVLVVMTLAGIALVRSVDTSNVIAGNLAFRQSATHSGDAGIEAAITWLAASNTGTTLHNGVPAKGYVAFRQDPGIDPNTSQTESWDRFWTNSLATANPNSIMTLATDASGNTVSYIIHRLCAANGDPNATATACVTNLSQSTAQGSSRGAGVIALQGSTQVYYRITARIAGPKNTVSYVQSIILM
jgi:Tfp pilus assembly protein PilX